jgi:hypothetical protein
MTKKNYKDKNDNEWTWEENAEVLEALKKLHETKQVPDTRQHNTLV